MGNDGTVAVRVYGFRGRVLVREEGVYFQAGEGGKESVREVGS